MRPPTRRVLALGVLAHDEMSMSPGLRLGERASGTPGIRRAGRRLTYWSNSRRNLISEPHSETWSGTVAGQPTAPKKIASWPPIALLPVVGHHRAVLRVVVAAGEVEVGRTQFDAEAARGGLEHAHALGHDFLADAVARDGGDPVRPAGFLPSFLLAGPARSLPPRRPRRGARPAARTRRRAADAAPRLAAAALRYCKCHADLRRRASARPPRCGGNGAACRRSLPATSTPSWPRGSRCSRSSGIGAYLDADGVGPARLAPARLGRNGRRRPLRSNETICAYSGFRSGAAVRRAVDRPRPDHGAVPRGRGLGRVVMNEGLRPRGASGSPRAGRAHRRAAAARGGSTRAWDSSPPAAEPFDEDGIAHVEMLRPGGDGETARAA